MSANPSESPVRTADAEESLGAGRDELGTLLRTPSVRAQAAAAAVVFGKIVSVDDDATVAVQLLGAPQARTARLGVRLSRAELLAAAQAGRPAILAFENGDPARPLVMGLVQPVHGASRGPSAEAEAARPERQSERAAESGAAAADGKIGPSPSAVERPAEAFEAQVDGRRVRIVAQDEIVLECGKASITLRRNGRVVIHGDYVETYSEGTNRIKGGQVRIN